MFRVSIKDADNVETNAGTFETEDEVNEWYAFNLECFPMLHAKHVIPMADILLEQKRDQESHEAVELGALLMKKIRKVNRRKLKTGSWNQTQFNALLSSPIASNLERALWNGSLSTGKYLMSQMSSFYSDIEIAEFITLIDVHENKWIELI